MHLSETAIPCSFSGEHCEQRMQSSVLSEHNAKLDIALTHSLTHSVTQQQS